MGTQNKEVVDKKVNDVIKETQIEKLRNSNYGS